MRSRLVEMRRPTAHEPGRITQCRRFPIGSELSHDIDCGGGKVTVTVSPELTDVAGSRIVRAAIVT